MKKTQAVSAGIAFVLAIAFILHAQTTTISIQSLQSASVGDLDVMLQAVESTTPLPAESVPRGATFWSAQYINYVNYPPLPSNINNLPAWDLGDGNWLLADQDFDYAALDQQNAAMHMLGRAMGLEMDSQDVAGSSYTIDTNGLWLEITGVSNGAAWFNLHNASNQIYAVTSTTNLLANWNVETEVWPTNSVVMPFTVPTLERQNLFVRAEDWTGVTENGNTTPDWWFWEYFGTLALSDTNLDSTGNTLLYDYTNGLDPNVIQFTLSTASQYINTLTVPVQINLLAGVPSYYAVLVNDINQADANWQAYTATNITVNLGSTDGVYTVSVGLRGLPPNATATWQTVQLILNTVAPTVVITNPAAGTVSQPMIQVQGFANEALSHITFDMSNATGVFTNQTGYITSQYYDANLLTFTTNYFQCYDVRLTNGVNAITVHATDLAGNVTAVTANYTLDYSSDYTAPALSVIWPQNGTYISGSSFIFEGQVDDDTANITATVLDANGNTNTTQALVERNGAVWVQNLPLAAGTNTLTISATDAAGNTSSTNLTLYQSSVTVTMNPLTSDQLNKQFITVTGTVSALGYCVIVNGVTASVDASGNWTAVNVPVSPAGMAKIDVEVYVGDPVLVGSQFYIASQPGKVVLSGYFGTRHYQSPTNLATYLPANVSWNEDDEVRWTYSAGGGWYFYATNYVITTNGNYSDVTLFSYWWDGLPNTALPLSPDTDGFKPATADPNAEWTWAYDGWSEPPVTLGWGDGPGLNFVNPPWEFSALNANIGSTNRYSLQRDTRTTVIIVPSLPAASGQGNVYLVRATAREFSDPLNPNVFGPATVNYNLLMFAPYPYPTNWDVPAGWNPGWLPTTPTRYLGDVPLQPKWLQINGQTLINTGQTNADGSVWGETLVFVPSGASQDVTPSIVRGITLNNNDYTFDVQVTNLMKIVDANTGQDLTKQTNTVIVGQQMNLQCLLNSTNYTATDFSWTVPGFAISNYVVAADSSSAMVVTNFPLNNSNVVFYWVDGANNRTVQCSATVQGKPITATAAFNVLRPTAKISPWTTSVNLYGNLLIFEGSTMSGITFSNSITVPAGFSGSTKWVQVIYDRVRKLQDTNLIWHVETQNGASPYGDTPIPYQAFDGTNPVDNPHQALPANGYYLRCEAGNSFEMWMMFQPTGGIWVPLRAVNWSWSGLATNNVNLFGGNDWQLANGTNSVNPDDFDTQTYPTWNSDVQNRQWIPPGPDLQ